MLRAAPDEQQAAVLEAQVRTAWLEAGSPAVTLLLAHGIKDMATGADAAAEKDFDDAIALAPELAAPWEQRGLARFRQGDDAGAVEDFEAALQREPRDFAAFADLSRLAEARQNWGAAYAAWEQVMKISPMTPGGERRLQMLRRRARGEHI